MGGKSQFHPCNRREYFNIIFPWMDLTFSSNTFVLRFPYVPAAWAWLASQYSLSLWSPHFPPRNCAYFLGSYV
jgi:hypothetical protein